MRKSILLAAIISISSCSSIPVAVVPHLECPPPLELPKITPEELAPLSDEAYEKLVIRDKLRAEREKTLCSIIESTHE